MIVCSRLFSSNLFETPQTAVDRIEPSPHTILEGHSLNGRIRFSLAAKIADLINRTIPCAEGNSIELLMLPPAIAFERNMFLHVLDSSPFMREHMLDRYGGLATFPPERRFQRFLRCQFALGFKQDPTGAGWSLVLTKN